VIFTETPFEGVFIVDLDRHEDERGFFARTWCDREAEARGVHVDWVQSNLSHNRLRGTLRGMHYQFPEWEAKLVHVVRGAIFDAIVDLRPDSSTYLRHFVVELSSANGRQLLIPEGFAHGFVSLDDETDVSYQMSAFYDSAQARGFRWDDPRFAIPWPPGTKILSDRDRRLPLFQP
jgi:dTDP-4-dehydrorhamnose 3,5-epimerase